MKKIAFTVLFICFILLVPKQVVYANSTYQNSQITTSIDRTKHIIVKRRIHNGKSQHRRWNKDSGKWVDPHWIDD